MIDGTCALCGAPFTTKVPTRKFCGPRCSRAVEKAKERGREPIVPTTRFDCRQCGRACVPGENGVTKTAKTFCSVACKKRWHRARESAPPARPRLTERQKLARRKIRKAAKGRGPGRVVWASGRCSHCGDTYTAMVTGRMPSTCSHRCLRSQSKQRRRALKSAAFVENVSRLQVMERDGWRCQLCGDIILRDKVAPHPKSATLDHILPLSKGGTHEPANVQAAHFLCNSLKGDRLPGDQLRLIG